MFLSFVIPWMEPSYNLFFPPQLAPSSSSNGLPAQARPLWAVPACILSGWAGKVFARIYHSYCRHRGFIQGERERERGRRWECGRESACGGRGSAGWGREKKAGTDSSQGLLPYMPCLYTHTHTQSYVFICLSWTGLGMWYRLLSLGSLWESAPLHSIGHNQHQECKHLTDLPDMLLPTEGILQVIWPFYFIQSLPSKYCAWLIKHHTPPTLHRHPWENNKHQWNISCLTDLSWHSISILFSSRLTFFSCVKCSTRAVYSFIHLLIYLFIYLTACRHLKQILDLLFLPCSFA